MTSTNNTIATPSVKTLDLRLADLGFFSTQDIFDHVVKHFSAQGERAVDEHGLCCYRTSEGLSCAIGCLIPDGLYFKELEGRSVSTLGFKGIDLSPESLQTPMHVFLRRIQYVHDSESLDAKGVTRALHELAANYGLSTHVFVRHPIEDWT
jgi:hypothetical protein